MVIYHLHIVLVALATVKIDAPLVIDSKAVEYNQNNIMSENEKVFGELPASLIEEALTKSQTVAQTLLDSFQNIRQQKSKWRTGLLVADLLGKDTDLPYVSTPTTAGVDGACGVERLLANDFVAAAAVAVEGLAPPSNIYHWPEPRHLSFLETETHEAETSSILRGLMMSFELQIAVNAPHDVVLLDGSITTPIIFFNQSLSKASEVPNLLTSQRLFQSIDSAMEAFYKITSSTRSDRCWIYIPKYTTKREIGKRMEWPESLDDRGLLTSILEPGEYTKPLDLNQPSQPWHIGFEAAKEACQKNGWEELESKLTNAQGWWEKAKSLVDTTKVVYYRPNAWIPALRIEMSAAVASNKARLATALHAVKHQCGTPSVMEPYPLYMADRMVKHLPKAIPTFRQVASQIIAESYEGDISEVFFGMHGYRTESGE